MYINNLNKIFVKKFIGKEKYIKICGWKQGLFYQNYGTDVESVKYINNKKEGHELWIDTKCRIINFSNYANDKRHGVYFYWNYDDYDDDGELGFVELYDNGECIDVYSP
jgi:hypothetical protein